MTTELGAENSLESVCIPTSAFDWLCSLRGKWGKDERAFAYLAGHKTLCLDNYVGVLESPCGTRIEILPKIHSCGQSIEEGRKLLLRMLQSVFQLPSREADNAHIETLNKPVTEWVMHQFLQALSHLLKQGMRSAYHCVDEERTFLRGQINMPRQMRQLPHRRHLTHVRHNIFSANRPENRLVRSTLQHVLSCTRDADNWRLAMIGDTWIREIPYSQDYTQDFKRWHNDRHMAHYAAIRPWCELILGGSVPVTMVGQWQGISLLFPMDKLFEAFVAIKLNATLPPGVRLRTQSAEQCLCRHENRKIFTLRPDIILEQDGKIAALLDTKWKSLNMNHQDNYGLAQSDFYQLFAYGQKYMDGQGDMGLIYPKTDFFTGALPCFNFSTELRLWVLAFDLFKEELVWEETIHCNQPIRKLLQ